MWYLGSGLEGQNLSVCVCVEIQIGGRGLGSGLGAECGIWVQARGPESKCFWLGQKSKLQLKGGRGLGSGFGAECGIWVQARGPESKCIWLGQKSKLQLKGGVECRAPLQKGCQKHHGHKGDPGVTPGTCGAGGEKAQVILVWVRAPGVGNASHPRGLGVMRIEP
jgi:hypothetical protein